MTSVATERAIPTSPRRTVWTVFACMLVAALEGYDLQVIGVAAPQIRTALDVSPGLLGWMFSASLIGLAIGAVFAGWLADRVGRKPVLIGSVVVFGAFTLASAYAPDSQVLFLTRIATGLGLGGAMPNMIALVSETVSRKHMTAAVGIMFCGAPVGGIALTMLARTEGVEWRQLFIVGGALPIVIALLLAFSLVETHKPGSAHQSRPSAWNALFGDGFALSTLLLWVVFALTLWQLSLVLGWLPTLIVDKGHPPSQGYLAQLLFNVGSILGAGVISWFCDRIGARVTMLAVYAGMAATIFAISHTQAISQLLALSLAAGFTILGAQFALYGIAPRLYSEAVRGVGVGAAAGVGRIGAILGPIIAGQLMGAGADGDDVLLLMTPLIAVAGIAFLILTFTAQNRLRKASADPAGVERGDSDRGQKRDQEAGNAV